MYSRLSKLPSFQIIFIKLSLISVGIFCFNRAHAQSLGDPIVNITFGSGSSTRAGALSADSGSTTYTYSATGFPNDNSYTIANTTAGMFNGWWTTTDHTGNANGYMMIVNGSYTPGIFYTRTVAGLCGSTTYQFAAWIKNLLNYSGILPNVTFSIETKNGTVLGSGNTGDIATGNAWIQYPFMFTTPANTDTIVIKMTNNAPGGIGNDIAIDDITFRPYGAQITAVFDASTAQSFCAGTTQTLTINATTTLPAGYVQKVQLLVNGIWADQSAASTASSVTVAAPTVAGTYYYRFVTGQVSTISSSECVVASNQLTVTVNATPTAVFSVQDTTCFGSTTVFTDQSTSNNGTIIGWAWDFGDGSTSTVQNPSHVYAKTGVYTVSMIATNSNGCVSSPVTKVIFINSLPLGSFSYSRPDCVSNAITFTDASTIASGVIASWLWTYGDGTTETRANNVPFQHTYTATGTYLVNLVVSTKGGCSASITQSITISPLPVVNFGTPAVCLADASASFTDSTTIADNSKLTYLWNFGDANATIANPNTSSLQNPSHKYSKASDYTVTLTVTSSAGCAVTKSKNFKVNGSIPTAAFNVLNSTTLCSNREVFFTNQSTVDFGNITKIEMFYDYGNNPTVVEIDNAPYAGKLYRHTYPEFHTPPATKNYQVRMLAYSGGTCVSEADQTITLLATPQLAFTAPASVCSNSGVVQLIAGEVSGISGTGVFSGTGVSITGVFDPNKSGAGTFPISYIYTAGNACSDTVTQNITVNPSPVVYAGADTTVLEGGSAALHATASGDSLTYSWSPALYLNSNSVLDPIVSPVNDITYTLTVTNAKGCSVSSAIKVTVLKSPVIPNTFTPNGDGINDTWVIKYLNSYVGASIEVFNRYGQKVYTSIGYPVPWDGRYNGKDLPAGVYYYLINPMHGRKAFSGWLSIIR
ncbi:MAG: PKD domain-containing protein [Mucilaginibacter sp.]